VQSAEFLRNSAPEEKRGIRINTGVPQVFSKYFVNSIIKRFIDIKSFACYSIGKAYFLWNPAVAILVIS